MSPSRIPLLALAADAVAVLIFAAVGRLNHTGPDDTDDLVGLLAIAAPFAVGLVAAWATPLVRANPIGLRAGLAVLTGTAVIGLLLRAAFTGRLPLSFAVVTVLALVVLQLGWRGLSAAMARRVVHG